jgi:hypothetical protein
VRAHHGTGPEALLAAHVVERTRRVLQHVKFVVNDSGPRQHLRDDVAIRAVHVHTDRVDSAALLGIQPLVEQRAEAVLAAIPLQPDHFAAHQIRQHRPELLPCPAVNFIDAEMPRPAGRPSAIPRLEKRPLGAPGRPPTHRVADGGVIGRHRLAIQSDTLAKPPRQPRVRIRKADALRPDPAASAPNAAQRIAHVTGCSAQGRSSHVRTFASRTRPVR